MILAAAVYFTRKNMVEQKIYIYFWNAMKNTYGSFTGIEKYR